MVARGRRGAAPIAPALPTRGADRFRRPAVRSSPQGAVRVAPNPAGASYREDRALPLEVLNQRLCLREGGEDVERPGAGVAETVWSIARDNDGAPRLDSRVLLVDPDLARSFEYEEELFRVRVPVRRSAAAGLMPLLEKAETLASEQAPSEHSRQDSGAPLDELLVACAVDEHVLDPMPMRWIAVGGRRALHSISHRRRSVAGPKAAECGRVTPVEAVFRSDLEILRAGAGDPRNGIAGKVGPPGRLGW
jgi:hypothetical protein